MVALESPPTTTGGHAHIHHAVLAPLGHDSVHHEDQLEMQSSLSFLTDGTLAQFFIPLFASLELARKRTQKPTDVACLRLTSDAVPFSCQCTNCFNFSKHCRRSCRPESRGSGGDAISRKDTRPDRRQRSTQVLPCAGCLLHIHLSPCSTHLHCHRVSPDAVSQQQHAEDRKDE